MQNRLKIFIILFCCLLISCEKQVNNNSDYLIELANDYRLLESKLSNSDIFHSYQEGEKFIQHGDIIVRFKSSQCLDCMKSILEFLAKNENEILGYVKLLASFDSDIQLKSYLRKNQVDGFQFQNVDSNFLNKELESIPGPYIFKVSNNKVSQLVILDKHFENFNLRSLSLLIQNSREMVNVDPKAVQFK